MRVLGFKDGHDGTIALVEDGRLIFSLEAEKDSYPRCTSPTVELFHKAAQLCPGSPDVLAIGGWTKGKFSSDRPSFSGYFGVGDTGKHTVHTEAATFFGNPVKLFSSSHERSHIWCAYGMSPFPQGQPCYVLEWEGNVGNFYKIDENLDIIDCGRVLEDPGNKYTFLYSLADIGSPSYMGFWDTSHPGKLMALAAFGEHGAMAPDERAVTDYILSRSPIMTTTTKDDLSWSPYHNIGVQSQAFKDLAAKFSDRLFDMFYEFAVRALERGLPLLITGGCGLNCTWNSKWQDCGLFSEVFVPPCCNDSGSAIGTAVDAMRHYTGGAKLAWSVYAGEEFLWDCRPPASHFEQLAYDPRALAARISKGSVVAWVEGRYEIGPRALGHRSILAEPFHEYTRDHLNSIKRREEYRPIAPICLDSVVGKEFSPGTPSPHMLFFHNVRNHRLRAVTHVDGTARVQTISSSGSALLAGILAEFEKQTGSAVLCNTSLNYPGRGFINRMSDLVEYSLGEGIDEMIINGINYRNKNSQVGGS